MKLQRRSQSDAFTLWEMLISLAIVATILAVTLTSSIALQKSLNEADNYISTQMQQIRIIDYLNRDVKRGLSVISSVDRQTVTIALPRYIIQGPSDGYTGDPEAIADPTLIGTPRSPIRTYLQGSNDPLINYVPPPAGPSFPDGVTVSTVVYSVQGTTILRTEDGRVTTIASSTDNIVPQTTDIELANTEYTTTAVTFEPISVADRDGTVVFSTAYLRNRRRPPPAVTGSR
jgi:prepilin-type N-terminal cleavage/methylation domain-containing protein